MLGFGLYLLQISVLWPLKLLFKLFDFGGHQVYLGDVLSDVLGVLAFEFFNLISMFLLELIYQVVSVLNLLLEPSLDIFEVVDGHDHLVNVLLLLFIVVL